jgi:polyisoprenoid-binding protein YceI
MHASSLNLNPVKGDSMFIRSATFALLAFASGAALAAPETYDIDPLHTQPYFEINHLGFSTQRGHFGKASGQIVLDRAAKHLSADVTIDVNSLDTGYEKRNEHLKSEDFFDVAKYPTITFKANRARFRGDRPVSVEGDLTMHGVTHPVTLTLTSFRCAPNPVMKKDECAADATATIKRSDYGMKFFLPALGDEVRLLIPVESFKQ